MASEKPVTTDISELISQLESHDPALQAAGLATAMADPQLRKWAEGRYLSFVRARQNDPEAGLERLPEATPSQQDGAMLVNAHYLGRDYLSFGMMDDGQVRLMVDALGAVAEAAVDVDSYLAKVAKARDLESMSKVYAGAKRKIRAHIKAEAARGGKGWMANLFVKLNDASLNRIMLDHTDFGQANQSPVLRGYMLCLGAVSIDLTFDIFQSYAPDLTPVFWTMRRVPKTAWGDTEAVFPRSPLSFLRKATFRRGDGGKWLWWKSHPQK